jgi:endonuclease/exonuclease/phosphatase family metal-dependent hydrolase
VRRLRVLSYNVHGLRDDLDALARVVAGSGAHVVFVQEAPKLLRWRARCAELARRCGLVVLAGGGDAAGNLLLGSVAVQVHAACGLLLPLTPGEQLRGAAVAFCSYAGRSFTAVGTHLGLDAAERERQVTALLDRLPPDGPPLVVAGDFNEPPGGAVWGAFTRRLDDAAVIVGASVGGGPVSGATAVDAPTYSCASPRRRIDGFFVDPRIRVTGYQVLDSADARRASDHFPVYAELTLPA